ncbi:MAG TPA: 4Fe-4S binding protein [Terracidiphilus sp.]|nr:4Fe-4S binding protein [Terracidiphilus sp.]
MLTLSVPTSEAAKQNAEVKQKKVLIRRSAPERSQQVRRAVQFAFLLLNAVIGLQFILWVRYFESAGAAHYFERPAGVDGWLPIAGLMNLRYFLATHRIPAIHPSAMVLIVVFLLSSLLVKKAFCSWFCPVGTVSEYLWKLGRRLFRRNFIVPKGLDFPLRSLKYILLAFFVYIVFTMAVPDLGDFLASPFGIVADVKMLNFFRYLGTVGMVVIAALVVLSVFIQNFWCRFLCPYGALMGIVSVLSPVKIRRDGGACIDCGKCNKACPSHLPVDRLVQIRSVECTGCMECVAVCPAENALQMALMPRRAETAAARWRRRALKPQVVAAVLAVVFFGLVGAARASGHWQTNLSRPVYMQLVPNAENIAH